MSARRFSLFARRPPVRPAFPEAGADGVGGLPTSDGDAPPPPPPAPLHPAAARRERRLLARQREIELRDIGGLTLEMVRRDSFRPDLLFSRCAEVLDLEGRMHEIDSFLAVDAVPRTARTAVPCKCGAPLVRGAHFCSHCGRPAAETPPVVSCDHCGNPLPAEANFCAFCGNTVAEGRLDAEGDPDSIESTAVEPPRDDRPGWQ